MRGRGILVPILRMVVYHDSQFLSLNPPARYKGVDILKENVQSFTYVRKNLSE